MKYRIALVLIITVITLSLTGCAEGKAKEFQDNVDKFCETYEKLDYSDDSLSVDIRLTNCMYALSKMASLH